MPLPKNPDNEPSIIIGPDHTTIDGLLTVPKLITIILENGHGYEINETILILEKHDQQQNKHTIRFNRIKRFKTAFKKALKESLDDEEPVHDH